MFRVFRWLIVLFLFVTSVLDYAMPAQACNKLKPSLYSIKKLDELRKLGTENPTFSLFLKQANTICNQKPITVVGKQHSYSDNPHDYCSVAPYSWPDENNPNGPYVTKDGKTNPERNKYDRPKLDRLADNLQILGVAFYITREQKYYDSFEKQLRVWFVDEGSYMEPNFKYAQVVKGLNGNKGQAYGLCELEQFTPILESIFLVNKVKRLDKSLYRNLEGWFSSFLGWILQGSQWSSISKSSNNIVAGCYVAMIEMGRFTKNKKLVKQMANEYTERILTVQVEEDGKQPAELRRTIGYGYSVSNLENIVDFALIMEQSGVKYYKKNQERIDAAFEYLLQFVGNHDAFPYKQEASWEYYEAKLKVNATRLQRMSSRRSAVKNHPQVQTKNQLSNVLDYVY